MTTENEAPGKSAVPSVSRRTMIVGSASAWAFAEPVSSAALQRGPTSAFASTRVSVDDRDDITELYARYAWGLDLADTELFLSALGEDCEFDHPVQGKTKGRAAILKNLEELWYGHQAWWFGRQHVFHHFMMEPHPEGVRVHCYVQLLQFSVEFGTTFVLGLGTHEALCVRRDDRWVFKSMRLTQWRTQENVPWKGKITMAGRPGAKPPTSPGSGVPR